MTTTGWNLALNLQRPNKQGLAIEFAIARRPKMAGVQWAVVGLAMLLSVPFTMAVVASLSGVSVPSLPRGVAYSMIGGPAVSALLMLFSTLRIRLVRDDDRSALRLAFTGHWVEYAVLVVTGALWLLFVAHLFADGYACAHGVTRAC